MNIDKGKLFHCWDDLCSMVFSDLTGFIRDLLIKGGLTKKELAELLDISIADLDKIFYSHSSGKSNYDKVEKKLQEKKNAFLDALKECKSDSKYLQQLRELAKANAGNEKLCELIRYYTN